MAATAPTNSLSTAEVEETGDRMVFAVRSRSHPERAHRVDLLANEGKGGCSCVDWSTRRWPSIRDGGEGGTKATCCFHVIRARRHFLNGLLAAMAKGEEE